MILAQGGLATAARFQHQSERYTFPTGIYVDREALLDRREAQVVVRPCASWVAKFPLVPFARRIRHGAVSG